MPRSRYRALAIIAALSAPQVPALQAGPAGLVRLGQETAAAFRDYVAAADKQNQSRLSGDSPFLWSQQSKARARDLARGKVVVASTRIRAARAMPGGLVHDWTAAVLVPHANAERLAAVVADYDTHADTFAPGVLTSRILERNGTKMRVAMRLLKKSLLTVVLDTEHAVEFERLDSRRWWGRSQSSRIQQVEKAGTPNESLRPPGHDQGFLWQMVVYWRFADTPDGTVVEHRSISLTRSPPKGLGWILRPLLEGLPRRSLANILSTTRDAAAAK